MKKLKRIQVLLVVAVMAIACMGCGKKTVVGKWSGESDGQTVTMSFEKDGTGTFDLAGLSLSITYKTDGDKLTLTTSFLGQSSDETYTYKLDGNNLVLTDESGETVTLTKSK